MIAKKGKFKKDGSGFQDKLFAVLIVVFLVGTAAFLIVSNARVNKKRADMINQINELQEEIRTLEERNELLKTGLSETETDVYWEEKMREQGYKKPGEEVVVVLPSEEQANGGAQTEKGLWDKIKEKLGF